MSARVAKIKCPHCGESVTVRDAGDTLTRVSPENAKKIWAAADEMFAAIDRGFAKIFDRKLWP